MAFINCIECDAEISSRATTCPRCGCPMGKSESTREPVAAGLLQNGANTSTAKASGWKRSTPNGADERTEPTRFDDPRFDDPHNTTTVSGITPRPFVYAGFWLRAVAVLLDTILLLIPAFIVAFIILLVFSAAGAPAEVIDRLGQSELTGRRAPTNPFSQTSDPTGSQVISGPTSTVPPARP